MFKTKKFSNCWRQYRGKITEEGDGKNNNIEQIDLHGEMSSKQSKSPRYIKNEPVGPRYSVKLFTIVIHFAKRKQELSGCSLDEKFTSCTELFFLSSLNQIYVK